MQDLEIPVGCTRREVHRQRASRFPKFISAFESKHPPADSCGPGGGACAAFHASVAMVTGEVPARAAEAEGGVGEGAAGGGGGGEEIPRGGGWMSAVLLLRAHALEVLISDHVDPEVIVHL